MSYAEVCEAVEKIDRRYCQKDPFRLCKEMGIILLPQQLGNEPDAIKGFFLENKRIKTITVNCDLPHVIQKIIIAHEIGHAALHRKSGIHAFHEVGLFDESSYMEQEANLFAAEYLLDDQAVLTQSLLQQPCPAAAALNVPMELLDFKFRVMKWKGYKLMEPPISARSNFLRDMEVPPDADYNS